MILKSIRLHPFGKFADRTHTFKAGLDIIEGPNEHGKSTISNAVKHALYTSTFPTKGRKTGDGIERWFPHAKGQGAELTLAILHDGITWTINKRWPVKGSTLLTSDNDDHFTGEDAESRIEEIIGFNAATWKHVFHTTQAELANTVSELGEKGADLDDLVSSASASATQDVSAERLLQLIDERIDVQFKRWDDVYDRPEGGRGIENPWKAKNAVIYNAFLEWQENEDIKKRLEAYNQERDRLQSGLAECEAFIAEHTEEVRNGAVLRRQLEARSTAERDAAFITSNVADLQSKMESWPTAELQLKNSTKELEKHKSAYEALQTELQNAERQNSAEATRRTHQKITEAKAALDTENAKLASLPAIEQDAIDRAAALEKRRNQIDTQIAAHKLAATISAERSVSISYALGQFEHQQVTLEQGALLNLEDIPGQVRFELDGVSISVASATADIQALAQDRQETEADLSELLHNNGAESVESLKQARENYLTQVRSRDNAERSYRQYLEGQSIEEWQARFDALKDLPQTRSMADVNTQMVSTEVEIRNHSDVIEKATKELESLTAHYTDKNSLMIMLANATAKLAKANAELEKLPKVPEGYATADEFIERHEELSEQLQQVESRREGLSGELRRMTDPPSELTPSELADLVELTHDAFQRALQEGAALKRIRDVVERKAAETAELSPLQKLPERVSKHFAKLTNGAYTAVEMVDVAPSSASGKVLNGFDVSRLSQGTKTSLALATRLALAESYLENRKGVIMLDDPFVDMDTDRRTAAMALIKSVSKTHQVVMFTCHGDGKTK